MSRFDQDWCNALAEQAGDATTQGDDAHLLYVVTDTSEGKVAFHIGLVDGAVEHVTAGKLPRGEKADITITATCLLYTSPSPRDATLSRMPSSA